MHGNMFLIGHTGSLGFVEAASVLVIVHSVGRSIVRSIGRAVVLKSCNPRAEADHVARNNHVPVAGITKHLSEEHPFAIFAWYCMHVETRAMSDKYWMSDWLANDVIGMGIDVRIPIASVLRTGYHFQTYLRVGSKLESHCAWRLTRSAPD
jgi:hypothetical protein